MFNRDLKVNCKVNIKQDIYRILMRILFCLLCLFSLRINVNITEFDETVIKVRGLEL